MLSGARIFIVTVSGSGSTIAISVAGWITSRGMVSSVSIFGLADVTGSTK